jgi:hypothetical protein
VFLVRSGRLHSEFVWLLFLQTHRETDRFFSSSGVQFPQHDRDHFHFHRLDFSWYLKSKVGLTLTKVAVLRITFNINGTPITCKSHTRHSPITLINFSSIILVFIFRCSSSPTNPVYVRRADFSGLVFSLSSHRHSEIGFIFRSRFIDS